MITLDIKPYCHGCHDFSPKVDTLYAGFEAIEQVIRCEYCERCEGLIRRIRKDETNNIAARQGVL